MSKILIIEDEPVVVSLLKRIITGMGHEVVVAVDGVQGLALARSETVAVIVSDLHLPGEISGMDLIRRLHSVKPQCAIVIVSGYPSPEIMDECEQMGIKDFLTKPFEMTFVQSVIESILRGRGAPATPPAKQPL
ncbi:MAG: response regulator [Kiritimatiellaeota bacterium]|nr:response regulator [Kiritimatiellota bacterium]